MVHSHLVVFNTLQNEFKPFRDIWQAPSHLKLDQNRLKYSAIFRRFNGPLSDHGPTVGSQQEPIPMWIADMDIPPCEDILSAISRNLRTTYGYQSLDIGESVAKRFERSAPKSTRFKVESVDVVDVASVIGAIDVALRTFCRSGEKVMLLTPTYSPLSDAITNNGLKPLYVPVIQRPYINREKHSEISSRDIDKKREQHHGDKAMSIDLAALDKSASAFVICHPNNPTGTVLSAKEQGIIMDFCALHNILLITDEVHSEFAFNSYNEPTLMPMFGAELDDEGEAQTKHNNSSPLPKIIHINSVSKAFNLASIPGASFAIIKDRQTRETFARAINTRHLNASNLGKVALIAAYERGSAWLDNVKSALSFNRKLVVRFFEYYGLSVNYTMGRAGYFLWLDLSSFTTQSPDLGRMAFRQERTSREDSRCRFDYRPVTSIEECVERGVIGNDGAPFGAPHHVRLNLACHPAVIETALQRLCFIQ